eukprot:6179160-Pleurochrysis_carterae.AAC.2
MYDTAFSNEAFHDFVPISSRGASGMATSPDEKRKQLLRPHIDSFDWFLQTGIGECVKSLPPIEIAAENGKIVRRVYLVSALTGEQSVRLHVTPLQ